MDAEMIVGRATLKYAVARKITCPIGGRPLDAKNSIMVEVTMRSGNVISEVCHVDEEDVLRERISEAENLPNVVKVEWLDGRQLFGRTKVNKS